VRSIRALVVCTVGLALGCQPTSASTDAAIDGADAAACTLHPGDLPGPRAIAAGALLPNMTFATATGTVALTDHHVPCAPDARLIVVRSLAAWSSLSDWQVAHTAPLLAHPQRARFRLIDVLVAGDDALPSRAEDLAPFAARYDAPPDALGLDPMERFGVVAIAGIRLPIVLLIDARTLELVRPLFAPRAGEIEDAIDAALARLDGTTPPSPRTPTLADARFYPDEWDVVHGMAWPATLPADASNAHADDPLARALGQALFEDPNLSPSNVGCASCHQSALGYGDARPLGHGVADVTRNTPTLYATAVVRWPFWDGRVDSLWAQALGPAENPREMGSSRLFIAHEIASMHRAPYEAVFGVMPDLSDTTRFPAAGHPGDAAWDAMAPADQATVTRIFTNAGKAIEAFERTLAPPHTRFDDYVAGNLTALTDAERDGLLEFVRDGCIDCHFGPALSNGAFHDVGVPGAGSGATLDVGRLTAFATLGASPFRRQGAFSDASTTPDPLAGLTAFPDSTTGAFRTPTLRALSLTAPYGHAGTFTSVHDVVLHYANITMPHPPDPTVAGTIDPHLVGFDATPRVDRITAFLMTL
jgi:cytochrome c peroxidase